jgi:ATP-dependent DNA ligase
LQMLRSKGCIKQRDAREVAARTIKTLDQAELNWVNAQDEERGKDLVYVGKAGTGFTTSMILELARLLKPITLDKMPLAKKPDRKNKIDHWAAPKYWAEVEYRDITTDGLLRYVTFRGLYPTRTAKKPLVAKFK